MNTPTKTKTGLATPDMLKDAAKAEKNLQQTGLHITLEELQNWRDKLKNHPQVSSPKPHK
ncbi:MAG: hypothetical protein J6M05_00090 [Cardiobacteriaceae bacterium]|nr:hypothetical protein [Cardiobacteriaceae bacterium]